METVFWVTAIVILAANLILLAAIFKRRKRIDGTIVVNTKDPNKDVYTLRLGIPFGEIKPGRLMVFDVKEEK